jgi:hypothetical protein
VSDVKWKTLRADLGSEARRQRRDSECMEAHKSGVTIVTAARGRDANY